ncbi:MAG: hypothetical protein CMF27_02245 [Kiritimatiellaceae bacterium]|jgi:hypothetical protein|nr:hypothetical protein [Kiritimatiellaceae bacterium]
MGLRFNNLKKRAAEGRCPITQIEFNKPFRALSKRERQVRFHFQSIRIVAFIHLLIAIGIPFNKAIVKEAQILLIIINLLIALLLSRFTLLGYRMAVVYYFLFGMVSTLTIQRGSGEQFIGIILALLALYLIGNQTSKSMFDRSIEP